MAEALSPSHLQDNYISALSAGEQALLLATLGMIVKFETLRCRRRYRRKVQTFKWLEVALNLVKIKNPYGSVQTNP